MGNEIKWLCIMIAAIFGMMFVEVGVDKWSNNQAKIACYEASKSNQTLKCEDKKQ